MAGAIHNQHQGAVSFTSIPGSGQHSLTFDIAALTEMDAVAENVELECPGPTILSAEAEGTNCHSRLRIAREKQQA
jgi:hypothetical protein